MKSFAIRVDSSNRIGSGHFSRMMVLAQEISELGHRAIFISRFLLSHHVSLLMKHQFRLVRLELRNRYLDTANSAGDSDYPKWNGGVGEEFDALETLAALNGLDCQWIVVDSYSLSKAWESTIKSANVNVCAIDDLYDRVHSANILINHNPGASAHRYSGMLQADCTLFLGHEYALLARPFQSGIGDRSFNNKVSNIFLYFGAAAHNAAIITSLRLISEVVKHKADIVIVTSSTETKGFSGETSRNLNLKTIKSLPSLQAVMCAADFVFGAGGVALLERCAVGAPSATYCIAPNQQSSCSYLHNAGATYNLGDFNNSCDEGSLEIIARLLNSRSERVLMSKKAMALGISSRKHELITNLSKLFSE